MISSSCEVHLTDAKLPSSWVVIPTVVPPIGTVVTADTHLEVGDWICFVPRGSTEVAHCQFVTECGDPNVLLVFCPIRDCLYWPTRNRVRLVRRGREGSPGCPGSEGESEALPLRRAPNMGNRERMIWDLAWDCHRRHGPDFWAQHGVNIFTKFVELAERWMPQSAARPSGALIQPDPRGWEMACERYVRELRWPSGKE
jgi:hypothetical protein